MTRHNSRYLIASGFVLMLALMVALAAVGLTRMAAINQHMELIAHKHNVKIDLLLSMRNIVRERSLSMYAMYHMDDAFQREDEFTRFTDMAGEFIQLREQLTLIGLDEKEHASGHPEDQVEQVIDGGRGGRNALGQPDAHP